MMNQSIDALFRPSRVAIIGASRKEESPGRGILKNLLDGGFQGQIFPVNPKAEELMGIRCYSTVKDIEEPVDLAFIAIPRDGVMSVMKECIEKDVKAAVVITAGFKEADETGADLEDALAVVAKENDMALLGPNYFGLINTNEQTRLNGTFANQAPKMGNVSLISQSGAVGVYALESADKFQIQFAKLVSLGNKAVSTENDILEAYLEDEQTKAILVYLEDFEYPQGFLELASTLRKQKPGKPLVVLKAGGSKSGKRAAKSHTGALTENDEVLDHLFEQYGIIRAQTLESLFSIAKIFSAEQYPNGNRLCIITNAGGPGIITADTAEKAGLKVSVLSKELQKKLSGNLGGVLVEVLHDVSFRRAPINKNEALAMIEGINAKKMLTSVRDKPALDKDVLADYLLRISQLLGDFTQIKEIDINPLFGLKKGVWIADARLIVRDN